jgi:hypothetical protein
MPQRLPQASRYNARFPSLLALLAGDVLLEGCYDPACAPSRADELEAHGQQSVSNLSSGNAAEALRQMGIAMGVVSHPNGATTIGDPGMSVAGAVAPVQPVPPPPVQVPSPPSQVDGGLAPVGPAPVQPPPTSPRVVPHHPIPQARPGARMPTTPRPAGTATRGGLASVTAVPHHPNAHLKGT